MIFVAVAFREMCKLRRCRIGRRYAEALLTRTPFLLVVWATVNPVNWSPFRSSLIGYPLSVAAARMSSAIAGFHGNRSIVNRPPVEWYLRPTRWISVLFSEHIKNGRTWNQISHYLLRMYLSFNLFKYHGVERTSSDWFLKKKIYRTFFF